MKKMGSIGSLLLTLALAVISNAYAQKILIFGTLAQNNLNPDGSFAVDVNTANKATPDMWNDADSNPDTGADPRLANAQAVLARNQASLQSIPGYGSSYVADDPRGRLGPDGQPIMVIVIWIDDVTNPGNKSAASKAAPNSVENMPVDVRFASTNQFDTQPFTTGRQ